MARQPKKPKTEKKVTRYTYDDIKEPRTPETGHTSLLPSTKDWMISFARCALVRTCGAGLGGGVRDLGLRDITPLCRARLLSETLAAVRVGEELGRENFDSGPRA